MSGFRVEVDASDLKAQLEKLKGMERIASGPMRQAARESIRPVASGLRQVAPVDSGEYAGGIFEMTSVFGLSVEALAGTRAGQGGFPYPANLETSGRYHYRRGPLAGRPTRGKARGVLRRLKPEITERFRRAVEQIAEALAVR